jgi:DNA-binding transcriptional MerR regulator
MLKLNRKIEKVYYTMGEVAALFEVNPSLIRFWEKEFDILKPAKNKKGNRLFTKQDLDNLRIIYHLVKERGFTLQGAREKLKNNRDDVARNVEIIDSLQDIKSFLLEIKGELP